MNYSKQERRAIRENYKYWYPFCDHMIWFHNWFYETIQYKPSPIENNFLNDIRCLWYVLYPEYPVKWYFLDFADPIKKIWFELDGKAYHLDKEKDKARELEIKSLWWDIYRFRGSDTYADIYKEPDLDWNIEEEAPWKEYYKSVLLGMRDSITKYIDRPKTRDSSMKDTLKKIRRGMEIRKKLYNWEITQEEYIQRITN